MATSGLLKHKVLFANEGFQKAILVFGYSCFNLEINFRSLRLAILKRVKKFFFTKYHPLCLCIVTVQYNRDLTGL